MGWGLLFALPKLRLWQWLLIVAVLGSAAPWVLR